jgi:hypothetical protein
MIFPDTVFFEAGKPKVIIKMDKEYCLIGVKNAVKLGLTNIYKEFTNSVRERKKDNHGIFFMRYGDAFCKDRDNDELNDEISSKVP